MKLIDKKLLVESLLNHQEVCNEVQNETIMDVVNMIYRLPEVDTVDVCLATLQGMMGAIKALARGDLDG